MQGQRHHSESPYEERFGFARGVRIGDRIHIAGTAPVPNPGDTLAPDAYGQMMRCGEIATEAIEALGGSMDGVVRTRMFITDASDGDEIGRAHKECFGAADPASTMVVVAALLDPLWKVEIEVDAVVDADMDGSGIP
ncbi:MAG: RidA family protein [Armatimonadetes bacterium]|nr:MAG: RidA family protein [Armatimonadota bacterium]